jgi:hypothetical protein
MDLFMVLISVEFHSLLFFSLSVVPKFSIALFLLLIAYFICFQAGECFYVTPVTLRIEGSNGSTRLNESLRED